MIQGEDQLLTIENNSIRIDFIMFFTEILQPGVIHCTKARRIYEEIEWKNNPDDHAELIDRLYFVFRSRIYRQDLFVATE